MPSTVTFCFPTCPQQWFRRDLAGFQQNLKKWPESHEFAGIRRNLVNPLLRHHVLGQICSFLTSLGPKKIKNRERKKKPKPARFRRIPARFSPESLFMVAGITIEGILEKKIWKCLHWEKLKLRGVHCEFLNIGGRIEKYPKLQGVNQYFPLIKKLAY